MSLFSIADLRKETWVRLVKWEKMDLKPPANLGQQRNPSLSVPYRTDVAACYGDCLPQMRDREKYYEWV